MKREHNCIFIAAGGTGGHIYPALAIAEAFRREKPKWEVLFVGTPYGLENKLVPPRGFAVLHVKVGRLNQVSLKEKILTLLRLPLSFVSSFRLLRKFRPRAVVGVGGYASGPILLIASLMGIETAVWEPNAMPGLTNRWLSRFVDECWLVFDSARRHLKAKKYFPAGMPVRKEIEQAKHSGEHPGPMNVLIFGGSQGARVLNTNVAEMLKVRDEFALHHAVVHQTGPSDFSRVQSIYGDALNVLSVEVTEYLHDMHRRYEWADVVIARAGAASVAELAACGKAAILVPLPTAADNHQQKNAEALVQKDAAIMILQKDLTPEKLRATLQELEAQPERRHRMERNIRQFHQPQAAEKIVGHLLQRIDAAGK
jgi:UDP-N-acetylglucosamine--N-acetylmuramyl-(pentapeptide) pyrophosphoryl-undecaprenol N-acetylglucosamine transferase